MEHGVLRKLFLAGYLTQWIKHYAFLNTKRTAYMNYATTFYPYDVPLDVNGNIF